MAYTFDYLFAADPSNPQNIARNSSITIFAVGDEAKTPVALKTLDGQPYPNPVTTNANGFAPKPVHETLDQLAWAGGGMSGTMVSYEGMKAEAVAARQSAESAAALVGAPADSAIAAAMNGNGATKTALITAMGSQVGPLVADAIAADETPALAAAAAVDQALTQVDAVSTESIPDDSAEFTNADDSLLFAVDDIHGIPHLRGADGPINTTGAPSNSFEMVDGNDVVIFAVDDLDTNPHFRGAEEYATGYTETHLILVAGQSNSVGVGGPVPDGTNEPLSNLFTVPQQGAEAGQVVPATDPLAHPFDVPSSTTRGHAVRFGRNYALQNPDVRVVLVPVAASGTGFRRTDATASWAPAREGEPGISSLYRGAIVAAQAAAAQFTGTIKTAAILWLQGEADATSSTTGTQYASDLDDLIEGFRTELPGATDAPFIVAQMLHEFITIRAEGTVVDIDAAHQATPSRVIRTGYAPNPGPGYGKVDNTHYTGHGQWLLAASMWEAYDRALYNL